MSIFSVTNKRLKQNLGNIERRSVGIGATGVQGDFTSSWIAKGVTSKVGDLVVFDRDSRLPPPAVTALTGREAGGSDKNRARRD
jgi:hypothetical protein